MGQIGFQTTLSDDKSITRLQVLLDGEPQVFADLTADELSQLLEGLGMARASMAQEIPNTIQPGTAVVAVENPAWTMPRAHPEGGRVLGLRHPGWGWISYFFPHHEVAAISAALASDFPTAKKPAVN